MSTYFLSLNGEKYEVKEEHYYPLNKDDVVNAYVAPYSKYAFHIEKAPTKLPANNF